MEHSISCRKAYKRTSRCEIGRRKSENVKSYAGIRQDFDPIIKIMIILKLRQFNSVFAFSVRAILASPRAFSVCAFLAFPKLHDEILVAPRSDRYILDIALGHALKILNILLRILGQLIKAAAA